MAQINLCLTRGRGGGGLKLVTEVEIVCKIIEWSKSQWTLRGTKTFILYHAQRSHNVTWLWFILCKISIMPQVKIKKTTSSVGKRRIGTKIHRFSGCGRAGGWFLLTPRVEIPLDIIVGTLSDVNVKMRYLIIHFNFLNISKIIVILWWKCYQILKHILLCRKQETISMRNLPSYTEVTECWNAT